MATYVLTSAATEGIASLSIAFRDLASNPGVTVTSVTDGSAVTIDLTAPTLTSVTMSSDNAGYPSRANVGDKITVVIKANEAITGVSAMIAGQTATMSGSGTSYTAVYTIVSGVGGVSSDGLASLVIDFQDMASNAGAQQNSTTDGSGVTIDLTAPKLTTVTIVSNNAGNGTLANVGDTIPSPELATEIDTKLDTYEAWDFLELLRLVPGLGADFTRLRSRMSDIFAPLLPRQYFPTCFT